MTATLSAAAPLVLRAYYRILGGGRQAYRDGAAMRGLLGDHLDFTGPLAGRRPDSTDAFLRGVAGFIDTVGAIDIIQDVHDAHGSAVLHAATMPGGPMLFAEFFTLEDSRIVGLRLHYNGPEYLDTGGR